MYKPSYNELSQIFVLKIKISKYINLNDFIDDNLLIYLNNTTYSKITIDKIYYITLT